MQGPLPGVGRKGRATPRRRAVFFCAMLVAVLPGCFGDPEPLPPGIALETASREIDKVLGQEAARARSAPLEPAAPTADARTVSLWYYDHPILSGALATAEAQAAFARAHPNLRLRSQFIGDWSVAVQKLTVSLAAGDMPDVALVKRSWLARLIPSGRLAPLDTLLPPSLIDDLHPVARDACSWEGRLYAVPADGFHSVLYVNADLVGDEAPQTWDALREVARHVGSGRDGAVHAIGYLPFLETLWSAGGQVVEDGRARLDTPEAREALDYILALRNDGLLHPRAMRDEYAAFDLFLRGRAAMTVASSARMPMTARLPFPVRAVAVPGKTGPVSQTSDDVLVVFRRYADARQAALVEVLDYLTGPAVLGPNALDRGSVPVRRSVATDLDVPEDLARAYDAARSTPLLPPWSEVEGILYRYLALAYLHN